MEEIMNEQEVLDVPEDTAEDNIAEEADQLDREQGEEVQEPMYTQEQMQAELNRLAKRERERGRKKAEEAYAPYLDLADMIRQGAGIESDDPDNLVKSVREMFEQNGIQLRERERAVPEREQQILGEADAKDDIAMGIDYVLEKLDEYEQAPPQDFRETKRATDLARFASHYFAAQALEKQGVKAREVLGDKNFQSFAAKYRDDIPITEIYSDYKKLTGQQQASPKSTGSVKGQGNKQEGQHFTLEQARGMSRAEIRKHFDELDRSMSKW